MGTTSRIYTATDLTDVELHNLGPGLAAVFTQRAPGSESANQDSSAIIPFDDESGILVVADGAGGLPSGDQASEVAIQAMKQSVKAAIRTKAPLRSAILDGIELANRQVMALGLGAATTLAVAEINGKILRTYHVGDSQVLLVGSKGTIKRQTMSHSPVGYGVEAGLIDEDAAIHHEERHLVSNLLGFPTMHIEVGPPVTLAAKDTVVIASDGLYDNLTMEEIAEVCRKGQLLSVCEALKSTCHERMTAPRDGEPSKPDDLTLIGFRRRVAQD